jgi:phosphatidylserine decarboxylase
MLPLAPEGTPYILVAAIGGVLALAFGYLPVAVALWVAAAGFAAFFRDPARSSDAPADAILAPADGKVILLATSPPGLAERGLTQQVSIFMSPANVHVNRAPISGRVVDARWLPGQKFPAFRDKASELNEHSFVVLEGAGGTVGYKQIAGALARRVVCDLAPGEDVRRGQRVGLIKFGSRVDVFMPADAEILVGLGQRTRAGVSVLARFRPAVEQ